jgi:hypothetical protein
MGTRPPMLTKEELDASYLIQNSAFKGRSWRIHKQVPVLGYPLIIFGINQLSAYSEIQN